LDFLFYECLETFIRKIVNGGIIGLDKFTDAYLKIEKILE
jgi:hypothetical protein